MDGGCKIAASDVFVILQYVGKFSEIKSKTGKGMHIPGISIMPGFIYMYALNMYVNNGPMCCHCPLECCCVGKTICKDYYAYNLQRGLDRANRKRSAWWAAAGSRSPINKQRHHEAKPTLFATL